MGQARKWIGGPIVVLVAVLWILGSASAQFPFPQPQPSPVDDARRSQVQALSAQIKGRLEKAGLTVFGVEWLATSEEHRPYWVTDTPALYVRPSSQAVLHQTLLIWGHTYETVASEDAETAISARQTWTKYSIVTNVRLKWLHEYVAATRQAKSDAERQQALRTLFTRHWESVWDIERRQWADSKDFVNKFFVK